MYRSAKSHDVLTPTQLSTVLDINERVAKELCSKADFRMSLSVTLRSEDPDSKAYAAENMVESLPTGDAISNSLEGKLALRPAELAEALSIGRNSAYKLCNRADFPVIHVGHKIIIPVDRLRIWLDEQAEYRRK